MKHLYTVLILFASVFVSAQTVVSVTPQDTISAAALSARALRSIPYGVTNYSVVYTTTDVFGAPTQASGLLCVPNDRNNSYPLAVYSHGTVVDRQAVPSVLGVQERSLPQILSGAGMVVVAPDYLGLGVNDAIVHPYVHADSEASAGRDLLIAARTWLSEQDIAFNNQLFLTGYSQGGHATQALHRDLQLNPGTDELTVTAASHLSGPYSISDVMRETLFADGQATLPGYIIYTYIAYDYVYDLFDDFEEAFAPAYVGNIDSFARGLIDLGQFNTRLERQIAENGASLADLLQDSVVMQLQEKDTSTAIVRALIDNDTYTGWAPEAPTLIYYCTQDEQVPFRNAIIADSAFRAGGATEVTLTNGGALTHGFCIFGAVNSTLNFFLDLADVRPVSLGSVAEVPEFTVSPNPVRAGSQLWLRNIAAKPSAYALYDSAGRVVAQGRTTAGGRINLPANLAVGVKILRVNLADGRSAVRRIIVR